MAAKKFLRLVSGRIKEILGTVVSTGAPNDGDIPALDATGRLDPSLMPVGVGPEVKLLTAFEALAAGDFVNIFNDGGVAKARKADASVSGKEAHGFVLAAYVATTTATVYLENVNSQLVGLTPGTRYYLSAITPGGTVSAPPATAGQVVQPIGQSVSATELEFEPQEAIELA